MKELHAETQATLTQSDRDNLTKEIEQVMKRESDELIKVIRVFGDYYRCNWWVEDRSQAMWFKTGTIRRSSFVRATRNNEGVVVEQVR